MSDRAERATVGVVGERTVEPVATAVADAGGTPETGDLDTVLSTAPDAVVAVGEDALLALAARPDPPETPILPVDAGRGVRSVPRSAVDDAMSALVAGSGEPDAYPVLGVRIGDRPYTRALTDVTLVTAEPARISEYAVATDRTTVAQFRADGVVVATPAGSHGYARRVDAPVVAHGTGVGAVAPIAPFATDADHWILDLDTVSLRVERDEVPVELLADDRRIGGVEPGVPVSVSVVDTFPVLSVPASSHPYTDPG
ncbi:NAD(+)/NADH kinase [Halorientalis pallida]|uniref:ATP-NAD kinase n=1 Tax=Halorientalis pallida TaxID=2479928 RepID=A0A498KZP1_9EURY|nr:NAD(+)/NADH kinase [Halorientalis pallida]RXK51488.1 ATP-NAD kinase [Halorientalis pallida]